MRGDILSPLEKLVGIGSAVAIAGWFLSGLFYDGIVAGAVATMVAYAAGIRPNPK